MRLLVQGCLIVVPKPEHERLAQLIPAQDETLHRLPAGIRIYCVGGAVRDFFLGQPSKDRDYVVVGATIDNMIQAGFMPVGKDFPVFLHPQTHDEYALARTERKSGRGYKGFAFNADPSVTIQEDLSRRDLTINAIAIDHAGEIVDPFGGREDLRRQILRHVGPAFAEDPVRLLRLARFSARWPTFTIAPETELLCREIVTSGEANALVVERVWQEISTGLMEARPSEMIRVLVRSGAWHAVTGSDAVSEKTLAIVDHAAEVGASLEVRFALLANDADAPLDLQRLRLPSAVHELARLLALSQPDTPQVKACAADPRQCSAETLWSWLSRTDHLRRPERFAELLQCHQLRHDLNADDLRFLNDLVQKLLSAETTQQIAIAAQTAQEKKRSVPDAVRQAKLDVIREVLGH
jgi:tRNA nucleotidyltransferase (CCA-adding enzyme)